jgi:hypothetical protein
MTWLTGVCRLTASCLLGKGSTNQGVDHPIDLRISNFMVTDPAGRRLLTAPDAHLKLSLAGLLLGRIVPRTLEVDRGEFAMTREISGSVTSASVWTATAAPRPASASGRVRSSGQQRSRLEPEPMDQIQRAHFRNSAVTLRDRGSELVVLATGMDLELVRAKNGRVHGSAQGFTEPRLHLLSAHPIGLNPGAGDASEGLDLLKTIVGLMTSRSVPWLGSRTSRQRIVAAGQEFDDGAFDLDVDKDGLRLKGRGTLAKVPGTLDGTMDFNPGGADQIMSISVE